MKSIKYMLPVILATALAGCGKSSNPGNDNVLVSNAPIQVNAGTCSAVEGPFIIPSGASTAFTVTDVDNTDYMNVGVIDSAYGCNFSAGYGVVYNTNSTRSGEDNLPYGYYDFVVQCNNSYYPCQFTLDWDTSY